jgi:hypothetical protein
MASSMPADDRLATGEITFTLPRGYRAPLVRRGVIAAVVAGIAAFLGSSGFVSPAAWTVAAVFGTVAVWQAVLYLWRGRFRTRLSAQGIEVRGYVERFIPWSEVTGIEVGGCPMPDSEPAPVTGTPWNSPAARPWSRTVVNSEGGYRARLATVRVTRHRGRSVLLRAPLVTSWQGDPEFENKARLICQWWRDYGQGPAGRSPS